MLCAFQSCQIGLNFANEEEAKRFRVALNDLLCRRQKKTGDYASLSFGFLHFSLLLSFVHKRHMVMCFIIFYASLYPLNILFTNKCIRTIFIMLAHLGGYNLF